MRCGSRMIHKPRHGCHGQTERVWGGRTRVVKPYRKDAVCAGDFVLDHALLRDLHLQCDEETGGGRGAERKVCATGKKSCAPSGDGWVLKSQRRALRERCVTRRQRSALGERCV